MSRRLIVLVATAAFVALPAAPAMADGSTSASCVGYGASRQAKVPPADARNFGQFTSSSITVFPDPGISGYVTWYAHQGLPCEPWPVLDP